MYIVFLYCSKEIAVLSGKVKNIDRDTQNSNNKIQAAETARKSAEAKCATLEEKLKKAESSQVTKVTFNNQML